VHAYRDMCVFIMMRLMTQCGERGFLVNKYKAINSKYKSNYVKENITINDALPVVELTTRACDKSIFGIITDRLEVSELCLRDRINIFFARSALSLLVMGESLSLESHSHSW
jgi:hypothetical protein